MDKEYKLTHPAAYRGDGPEWDAQRLERGFSQWDSRSPHNYFAHVIPGMLRSWLAEHDELDLKIVEDMHPGITADTYEIIEAFDLYLTTEFGHIFGGPDQRHLAAKVPHVMELFAKRFMQYRCPASWL